MAGGPKLTDIPIPTCAKTPAENEIKNSAKSNERIAISRRIWVLSARSHPFRRASAAGTDSKAIFLIIKWGRTLPMLIRIVSIICKKSVDTALPVYEINEHIFWKIVAPRRSFRSPRFQVQAWRVGTCLESLLQCAIEDDQSRIRCFKLLNIAQVFLAASFANARNHELYSPRSRPNFWRPAI